MSRAGVQAVATDPEAAGRLLAQARRHVSSARTAGVDRESAYGLAYQAALKAMIAVLTADGIRVTRGAGGHVVTLREAQSRLTVEATALGRVDRMRRIRHAVFYDAGEVSRQELGQALTDVEMVLSAAERFVAARLDR